MVKSRKFGPKTGCWFWLLVTKILHILNWAKYTCSRKISSSKVQRFLSYRVNIKSSWKQCRPTVVATANSKNHHHHQAHAPSWSVAVSTRCFQCSRSWAHLQAELRPWLWGWRSAPRVRSHVWRGRPGGRFHSTGRPRTDVLSALEMSSDASILATWPKSWSRLLWISWDSCGGEPARSRTVALATWSIAVLLWS